MQGNNPNRVSKERLEIFGYAAFTLISVGSILVSASLDPINIPRTIIKATFMCPANCTEPNEQMVRNMCPCLCNDICSWYQTYEVSTVENPKYISIANKHKIMFYIAFSMCVLGCLSILICLICLGYNRCQDRRINYQSLELAEDPVAASNNIRAVCNICCASTPNVVFNCGHTACSTCAKKLNRLCHMCRQPIEQYHKLYLSTVMTSDEPVTITIDDSPDIDVNLGIH
jgi:hypothetical protein